MKLPLILLLALLFFSINTATGIPATPPLWQEPASTLNDAGEVFEVEAATEQCLAFGWIDDVLAAQKIAGQLTRAGFTVVLKPVDKPTGLFDHRVLLSAVPSLQGAYRKLRELKSRAIDGYVITRGEDSPGVSLGVFASQHAASKHQQDLTRLGYETYSKAIQRLTRRYQVIVNATRQQVPQAITRSIQAKFPAARPMKLICLDAFTAPAAARN